VPAATPDSAAAERRTSHVELLWDLVFVFAVTQVTTLLAGDLDWAGAGRAMVVLALVWWAWSAFVWSANAVSSPAVLSAVLLPATIAIFLTGLAIPHAFGEEALLFAIAYVVVRMLHLGMYAVASRAGDASWSAVLGFALTVVAGMGLLVAGALAEGTTRDVLWVLALAIDYAGPGWLTRKRLRGLQHVAVAHFAERYGLFVIICLGESIASLGVAASPHAHDPLTVVAVTLGALVTVGMWWAYFGRSAAAGEERLREHEDPVLAAADAYSYLHLLLVAGIIAFAAGARALAHHPHVALASGPRLALCGGVALYLLGLAAFRRRLSGAWGAWRLAAVAALAIVFAATSSLPAWGVAALTLGVLAALSAAEALDPGADGARRPRPLPRPTAPSR
jgi:low temperature requirement protein LtrA